ncbi:MAG TPA: AI-2E family transporter [Xanthobacteraceae bacterium]|jgi:predicted PurR-regulated permease PerM
MDRSENDLYELDGQRNGLEGKVPDGDDTNESQASMVVLPGVGWSPGRSRFPSLKSNLSVIASAAKLIIFIGLVAILYFGRPVFVPLAVAILLAFILAPLVRTLHRWHLGRIPSILTVVLTAFLIFFGFAVVLGEQVTHLAAALPQYQDTLTRKIDALRGMTAGRGTFGRLSDVLRKLNGELLMTDQRGLKPDATAEQRTVPVPVEIQLPGSAPLEVIQKIINPLLDPLLTTGIIIVFVIFFLVQREDLRDRLIRLAGSTDLHRTTIAIDDAAHRLSRYLLTQTALNAAFGLIIGSGLALIGIPNPVLWGILAAALRFVPYIGVFIAAAFPVALAAAVAPGWSAVILTAALFLIVELIVGQILEPLLYGHSTGVSPVAVVVAAMFWTWLWGPIGLLLSTPLTVCLDVLGRHVEWLRFLDILLGSKPALNPAECFYHRILSGNYDEEFEQAERMLKTKSLSSFYDEVAIDGLRLAAIDAHRGALDLNSLQKIRAAVGGLVADLSHFDDMRPRLGTAKAVADAPKPTAPVESPMIRRDQLQGAWASATAVLCIPGPGPLDQTATNMLAQILEKHGVGVRVGKHQLVSPGNVFHLDSEEVALVCLSYIDVGDAPARARTAIRRVQRQIPNATVLVGLWGPNKDESGAIRRELKASYYANSFSEAVRLCTNEAQPLVTAPAVFTRPLGCHQAEQDNRHPALATERASSLDGEGGEWIEPQ